MAGGSAVQACSGAGLDSGGAIAGGDCDGGHGRGAAQCLVPREGDFPFEPGAVARKRDVGASAAGGGARYSAGDARGQAADQGTGEGPKAQGEGAGGDHSASCPVKKTRGDLPTGRGRMISLEDRQRIAHAVEEAHRDGARLRCACAEAGITLRTLQRWKRCEGLEHGDRRPAAVRPVPDHALTEQEREQILRVASESSFSRVLRAHGQTRHRGRAKAPQCVRPPSTHVATAPRQVWCWDMTYLPATVIGRWFYLYLILDLFSRKIVGFEVHETDSSDYAVDL